MANYDLTLGPILTKRFSPFVHIPLKIIAGTDQYTIKAGYNLEVPNHWTLHFCSIVLSTDATVANRYIAAYCIDEQVGTSYSYRSEAVAASSIGYFFLYPEGVAQKCQVESKPVADANYIPLNDWSYLMQGDQKFRVLIYDGKAGDTVQVRAAFRWRNWDLNLALPELYGSAWTKMLDM